MSDSKKVVFTTLPNGRTVLSLTRDHVRAAANIFGFKATIPNAVWEAVALHGATIHWSGVTMSRLLHPDYTNDLDSYGAVEHSLRHEGYTVGQRHRGVARSFAEAVADCEQAERDGTL